MSRAITTSDWTKLRLFQHTSRLRLCCKPFWQLWASWLLPCWLWQYSDRLGGLMACFAFVVCFSLYSLFLLPRALVRWFLSVSFYAICLAIAAASPQPFTPTHCFKTLGSDWLGGLLGCWVLVVGLLFRDISLLSCAMRACPGNTFSDFWCHASRLEISWFSRLPRETPELRE